MKFSANRTVLVEALTVTGKVISRGVLPILSSYLFKIQDDKIEITGGGTGMEIFIKSKIEIPPSGLNISIGIPKENLFDLIKDSPSQLIDFEIVENTDLIESLRLKVKTSLGEYMIPIERGEDYPFMNIENPVSFPIPQKELLAGIDKSVFACGDDSLKPEYTGVYMNFIDNSIEFAATNGHMVTTITTPVDTAIVGQKTMLVPQKVITAIQSLPMDELITVMMSDRHARFNLSEDLSVEAILINEKFPDHKAVIPVQHPYHLNIRKTMLSGSVKRVTRFSNKSTNEILLSISNDALSVSSEDLDFGEKAEETLQVKYPSEEIVNIRVSGKYLLSCLNRIYTDDVSISFKGPANALILRDADESTKVNTVDNLILLMPMYKPN